MLLPAFSPLYPPQSQQEETRLGLHPLLHLDQLESFENSVILCISSCCSQMFLNPSLQVAAARQQPSSYSPPASSVTPAGETQPDCFVLLLNFEYVGRIEKRWISRRLTSNKLLSPIPQSLRIRKIRSFPAHPVSI